MLFYLSNEDKFLLYATPEEVVYVHYCAILGATRNDLRWKEKNMFENDHLKEILVYMKSDDVGDRNIGLKMLEQTLKIVINGEIVGHRDTGQFI